MYLSGAFRFRTYLPTNTERVSKVPRFREIIANISKDYVALLKVEEQLLKTIHEKHSPSVDTNNTEIALRRTDTPTYSFKIVTEAIGMNFVDQGVSTQFLYPLVVATAHTRGNNLFVANGGGNLFASEYIQDNYISSDYGNKENYIHALGVNLESSPDNTDHVYLMFGSQTRDYAETNNTERIILFRPAAFRYNKKGIPRTFYRKGLSKIPMYQEDKTVVQLPNNQFVELTLLEESPVRKVKRILLKLAEHVQKEYVPDEVYKEAEILLDEFNNVNITYRRSIQQSSTGDTTRLR